MFACRGVGPVAVLAVLGVATLAEGAVPLTSGRDCFGDPLPPGAVARLGTVRFREPGACRLVAYSPKGGVLASAGREGVALWDAETGKRKAFFRPRPVLGKDETEVVGLAFSHDGRRLAAGLARGAVHVWDVKTGRLTVLPELYGYGYFVAFSQDHSSVMAATRLGLQVAEVAAPGRARVLFGDRSAWLYTVSADGGTLAVSNEKKGELFLCDAATGRRRRKIEQKVSSSALSRDGSLLAVTNHLTVWVYDACTGETKASWRLSDDCLGPHHLAFSPDGKTLMAGGHSWDWATKTALRQFGQGRKTSKFCESLCFSPDGTTLATGVDRDFAVTLWDAKTGAVRDSAGHGHRDEVTAVAFSRDGLHIATAGRDETVRIWEAKSGRERFVIPADGEVRSLAFSPDGKSLAFGAGGGVVLADPSTGKTTKTLRSETAEKWTFRSVAFTADGKTLTACNVDNAVRWDVSTGRELFCWSRKGHAWLAFAVSPDGKSMASAVKSDVVLWDARGKSVRTLRRSGDEQIRAAYRRASFSPDGEILAVVDPNRGIDVWRVRDGSRLPQVKEEIGYRTSRFSTFDDSVAFSPDGRCMTACCWDGRVRVWEVATGQERLRFEGEAQACCFSPDGSALAIGGGSASVLLWRTRVPSPAATPDQRSLATLWDSLGGQDARKAYQAICTLAAHPKEAARFLERKTQPAARPDLKRIAALIHALDDEAPEVRERASKELEAMGAAAESALIEARKEPPGAEARRRIDRLLRLVGVLLDADRLRKLRAIEALELMGGKDCARILRKLAGGGKHAEETAHATAALRRLRDKGQR